VKQTVEIPCPVTGINAGPNRLGHILNYRITLRTTVYEFEELLAGNCDH
jgi:hypothetical protein